MKTQENSMRNKRKKFRKLFFESGIYSFIDNQHKKDFSMRDKRAQIFSTFGDAKKGSFGRTITFEYK